MRMKRQTWNAVQNHIQLGAALVSILLNSILVCLIVLKSPKSLGPYKYLMIFISVFEMLYSVTDVIVSPFFHSYRSTFLLMVNLKTSMFSPTVTFALTSIYCAFFGSSLAIFGIHFIYRYFASVGSKRLQYFHGAYLFLWLIPPLLFGALWAHEAFALCQDPAIQKFIRSNIMETFEIDVDDTLYIGPYFYQKQDDGSFVIDTTAISAMLTIYSSVFASFFTITYFGIKCYRNIKKLVPRSKLFRSAALQSQLFYALVTQTLIPVILMHVPVTLVYGFALFDKDIGMLSGFVSIAIALYPAIDPIPNIFIIKAYRRALADTIIKIVFFWQKLDPIPSKKTNTPATTLAPQSVEISVSTL